METIADILICAVVSKDSPTSSDRARIPLRPSFATTPVQRCRTLLAVPEGLVRANLGRNSNPEQETNNHESRPLPCFHEDDRCVVIKINLFIWLLNCLQIVTSHALLPNLHCPDLFTTAFILINNNNHSLT